jgi:hypothetical protein
MFSKGHKNDMGESKIQEMVDVRSYWKQRKIVPQIGLQIFL